MIAKILKVLFGSRNDRQIKRMRKIVENINSLEEIVQKYSEDELKAQHKLFKERFLKGESLESLLPEAFAVTREAAKRTLNMRHFDVQLIGGIILFEGKVAEMCTGEGKTLVATLPAYLNSITGHPVHIVTVNDYLAKRDAEWMSCVYKALGMSVGVVVPGMSFIEKKNAYSCDVVYATNNELGFDYLRDRMAYEKEQCVQRDLSFAIIDEVDSILIDEARTPLIISGAADDSSALYRIIDGIIPNLVKQETKDGHGDYFIDYKDKTAYLTDEGHTAVENILLQEGLINNGESLYHASNASLLHHVNAALRAHSLYVKNIDYIVREDQVIIIDEHTGRTMAGRRWGEGLHQAVEAKEKVKIQQESQTLASISFQNFFRLYTKIAGMTGTADTEAFELQQIYNLEVVVTPTNKPIARDDKIDLIYITEQEKYEAVIEDIKECIERKQPVLVGTISIENSEKLSALLKKEKIKHEVLNAKNHAREADIIAQAGLPSAVTIATNMAGRGTDIVLGGNLKSSIDKLDDPSEEKIEELTKQWQEEHQLVLESGGLHVIGTERHESRRIDNQLRGRSGRQGDLGSSQFYLSLDDPLMRIFASERTSNLLRRVGTKHGEAISHPMLMRSIESAQRGVEGRNFDRRKQMLEFDNVANEQRIIIYNQRDEILASDDIYNNILSIIKDVFASTTYAYVPENSLEELWDLEGLTKHLSNEYEISLDPKAWLEEDKSRTVADLSDYVGNEAIKLYKDKIVNVEEKVIRHFEKSVMLHCLDKSWRDHLYTMDSLRQGIFLRGYAQKDPRQEYKREAFNLFSELLENIKTETIKILFKTEVKSEEDVEKVDESRKKPAKKIKYQHGDKVESDLQDNKKKVGRNDPCHCGSGKKYKHCHGKLS